MCFALVGSCVGSCCVGCCGTAFQDCQVKHGVVSRLPYIFLTFLCCIFAIVMSLYGEKVLIKNSLLNESFSVCESESCKGNGSVYRVSFTLFVFFIIHAIIVFFVAAFHWLFFILKFLCLVGFLTATFFMGSSFFNGYADFARIASVIFLILQVVVLLTWALDVNDRLVGKIDQLQNDEVETESKCELTSYKFLIIFLTIAVYAAIIILWVYFFSWFYPNSSCSFNQAMIAITIVLVIIATVLPIVIRTGSIFATGVISFYMTYLCFDALSHYPNEECNTFLDYRSTASLWIGLIITALVISYAGLSVSSQFSGETTTTTATATAEVELKIEPQTDAEENDGDKGINESNYNDVDEKVATVPASDDDKYKIEQKSNVMFHLCMGFAAVYMCMLYTNWGTNTGSIATANERGHTSTWVNLAAEWVAFVLYLWILVAPKACPERFGVQSDDDK